MADMRNLIGQLKAAEAQSRVDWVKRQSSIHYNETRGQILEECPSAVDALRLAALMPPVKVTSFRSKTQIPIRSQGTAFSNYTTSTAMQREVSSRGTQRPATNLSARTDTSKINSIVTNENWSLERKL